MATAQGYVSGLRWSGIKKFLFEAAVHYHVNLKITDEEKGLLRTAIFFELEGDKQAVDQCIRNIKSSIEEANKE